MRSSYLASYKKLYLETAGKYCQALLSNYIKISQNPLDKAALEDMYISAHSLKSQSQAMGYLEIAETSSMIEKTIKNILAKNTQISDDLMVAIKDGINKIQESLQKIQRESKE